MSLSEMGGEELLSHLAMEMCGYCKTGDEPERRQYKTEKPYWVHTMIGFDDQTVNCHASPLWASFEALKKSMKAQPRGREVKPPRLSCNVHFSEGIYPRQCDLPEGHAGPHRSNKR